MLDPAAATTAAAAAAAAALAAASTAPTVESCGSSDSVMALVSAVAIGRTGGWDMREVERADWETSSAFRG